MRTPSPNKIRPEISAHCKRVRELLVEHLDHLLAPDEQRAVDEHLKVCPRCSAERAVLQKTLHLLNARKLPKPEESFWMELRQKVRQGIRDDRAVVPRQPLIPARAWVPAVAFASLLVLLFLWWSRSPQLPGPGQRPLLVHLKQEGLRSLEKLGEDQMSIQYLEWAQTPGDSLAELLATIPRPLETLERALVRENIAENPEVWEALVEEAIAPELSLEAMLEDLTEEQLKELSTRLTHIMG